MAFGLVYDDDEINKSIHGVPMQPGCARVSVDGPIQGKAKIPVPVVGEIETVEQAVGSYISWPRDLITFPNVQAPAVCILHIFCSPCCVSFLFVSYASYGNIG